MHPEEEDDDDDDDPSKEEGALPAFAHAAELFATVRQSAFLLRAYQKVEFFFLKKTLGFQMCRRRKKRKRNQKCKMKSVSMMRIINAAVYTAKASAKKRRRKTTTTLCDFCRRTEPFPRASATTRTE